MLNRQFGESKSNASYTNDVKTAQSNLAAATCQALRQEEAASHWTAEVEEKEEEKEEEEEVGKKNDRNWGNFPSRRCEKRPGQDTNTSGVACARALNSQRR